MKPRQWSREELERLIIRLSRKEAVKAANESWEAFNRAWEKPKKK